METFVKKTRSWIASLELNKRYSKTLRIKSTGKFKEETRKNFKLDSDIFWFCQRNTEESAILGQFSLFKHYANEPRYISIKTSKVNIFEVKSVLESNFERFRKSAIRENFNLKRDPQMKKTYLNQRCNFIHQHNEVRE